MAEMMRRWTIGALGREYLTMTTAPVPAPETGEILVKVRAVSLNPRDKMVIEGRMPLPLDFPFTPASDMAGVVEAVGSGAIRFKPGDRVISTFEPGWIDGRPHGDARTRRPHKTLGGIYPGVLAEYVSFPDEWFSAAPESLDDAEASTLPVAGLTAWVALVERGGLRAGQSVLVQGTGGVALFGLQIAKAHGAEVIVISGSDDKLARAKALGARHGINRLSENWVEAVYRLTANEGVDHILETVGGANLGRSIEGVAVHGRIYVIGLQEGFEVSGPAGPLLVKSPMIQGIGVGHRRALEDLVRAVDRTGLKPVIDGRYSFAELPQALDHLDRGPFGKVVIDVA
jgi:NADPH:quinone reductase-like Zn-dependent oxidoreductase